MSDPAIRVLFVEDMPTEAELELRELKRAGLAIAHKVVETREHFIEALHQFSPDIILSDFSMPSSIQQSYLIVYDAEHTSGQVLVDDNSSVLEWDFRNISATGLLPPPVVELVGEPHLEGTFAILGDETHRPRVPSVEIVDDDGRLRQQPVALRILQHRELRMRP